MVRNISSSVYGNFGNGNLRWFMSESFTSSTERRRKILHRKFMHSKLWAKKFPQLLAAPEKEVKEIVNHMGGSSVVCERVSERENAELSIFVKVCLRFSFHEPPTQGLHCFWIYRNFFAPNERWCFCVSCTQSAAFSARINPRWKLKQRKMPRPRVWDDWMSS